LKNYPQDVEGWVEVATINASNDFHVLDVNIKFSRSPRSGCQSRSNNQFLSPRVHQVSMIHDLNHVLTKQHGNYVLEMNMGIKQDHMPLVPSKPRQINVLAIKKIIHGSISWSNAYVDENMTINLIVNAILPIKIVFHIL
jgi:hypothetical protein